MSRELPDFDLPRFLPYRLSVAAERVSAGLARRYRSEFGISVAEWRVLVHLADAGEVSIRDLEARVSMGKSKASRAASRLVAAGYVMKVPNPRDRRLICLSLSDRGRALMADLLPLATAYQARLEQLLGDHLRDLDLAIDTLLTEEL